MSRLSSTLLKTPDISNYKTSGVDGLSISFLTPPAVTVATLEEIGKIDGFDKVIKGLWFQPGSYDNEVLELAENLANSTKLYMKMNVFWLEVKKV